MSSGQLWGCFGWARRCSQYRLRMETLIHMFHMLVGSLLQASHPVLWYLHSCRMGMRVRPSCLLPRMVHHPMLETLPDRMRCMDQDHAYLHIMLLWTMLWSLCNFVHPLQAINTFLVMDAWRHVTTGRPFQTFREW